MQFSVPPVVVAFVLLALILSAAVYDALYRRIPNWLTVSGVVTGLATNTFIGRHAEGIASGVPGLVFGLKGLGLGLGLYLFLYILRAMGAGDVKLMAAVGSMTGWENWFGIFLLTAITGGVISIVVSVVKGRLQKTIFNMGFILHEMRYLRPAYLGNEELDVRSSKGVRLPHGVVIAVGTAAFLLLGLHFTR